MFCSCIKCSLCMHICTFLHSYCSAHLSMSTMERRYSKNIIILIIIMKRFRKKKLQIKILFFTMENKLPTFFSSKCPLKEVYFDCLILSLSQKKRCLFLLNQFDPYKEYVDLIYQSCSYGRLAICPSDHLPIKHAKKFSVLHYAQISAKMFSYLPS